MRIFNSGRHPSLNRKPWALVEPSADREVVQDRFPSRTMAMAMRDESASDERTWIEFDPNPLDSIPLTLVGNPILADCRVDDRVNSSRVWFWLSMLCNDGPRATSHEDHAVHARTVLSRWASVFGGPDPDIT